MSAAPRAWLLSAALAGCAHGPPAAPPPEAEMVEAEGWTPLDPRRPLEARRRALAEAQKSAVSKAAGVSVYARVSVSSAVATEQRIVAALSGRILSYRVLEESVLDGFLKLRIRALVLRAHAPEGLRVAVACEDPALARAVGAAFAAEGFAVGAPPEHADFVVRAAARDFPLSAQPRGLSAARSQVSLEAVGRGGTRLSQTREAAAMDAVAEIARGKAAALAGRLAGEKLASMLKASLEGAAGNGP